MVFLVTAIVCIPLGMLEWEAIFKFSGLEWLNMRETILDSIYTLAFIFAFLAFTESHYPGKIPPATWESSRLVFI